MKFSNWTSTSLRICALLALIVGGCLAANAQRITGAIAGNVKDESGAMVSTAAIKATNIDTGFTRSAQANADGTYLIQYLPVGHYTVEVTAEGFKKFVQQNLIVAVDQTIALNATLSVGGQTQTVTVTEAPPLVETSTAELGRTVSPTEIISLPLVNRNAYAELSLTPGVMSNSSSAQSNANGTPNFQIGVPSTQVQVNGGIDAGVPTVSYYLDGGINMTGLRNYGNPLPNPDALQEFRIETNNFAAQYGRMSGAVVTAVTKSGTNQFHGSLFEFNRNTALNAIPWGLTLPQHYRRNMFGGAVGGPIKHDKTFFFFSYGGLRQVVGTPLTGAVLPTAAERLGDFSTDTGITIYAPGTTTQVMGTNSGPGCSTPTKNCIPQSLLDTTAATLNSKYVPTPNGAYATKVVNGVTVRTGGASYTGYYIGPTNQDEYLGKYDETISDKDHVSASFFYLNTTQNAFGNGSIPWFTNQSYSKQYNTNISDIHTLNATTANQLWLTFTRVAGGRINIPATGLDDLGSDFRTQGPKTLPSLNVSGYFSTSNALAGPVSDTDFYSLRDLVSMSKGKHQIDFGGEFSLEKDMFRGNLYNFGVFTYNPTGFPGTTGNALSDFTVGQVNSMEQDTPYKGFLSNWYWATFLQDNYKIRPNLTVNMGLRWDVQTSPVESQDLTASFVANVQSTKVPGAPKGVLFPGDPGVPRGIAANRYHHVSPRLGIAWDPFGDGKTAVRAGAGVFYGSVSANQWNQPANANPFAVRQTFTCISSFTHVYSNNVIGCTPSFPNGTSIFPYAFNASNPRFLANAGVETIDLNYQWPLTYQFNAAIQRQMPKNIGMTVAYVSTLSHDLPVELDANAPVWASGATTSNANTRRPYNQSGALGVVSYLSARQTASYHSLQVSASRPLTHNLMLSGFYVFGHSFQSAPNNGVGTAGGVQDFYALREERGTMDVDRRHTATISGIWKVDYYKGSNFLMKQVVNGWTISPIITMNSGTPINITTGSAKNGDPSTSNRPNLTGTSPYLATNRDRSVSRYAWFNSAAFTANGANGIGPGGADGNTPRNYLRAPGYRNVDLGLLRDFRFERGMTLQLRGEATNAFNIVSLNGPNASLSSTQFGWITSAATQRLLQVGARFTF